VAVLTPEDFDVEIIDMCVQREKYAEGIKFESASQFLNQLGDRISKVEEDAKNCFGTCQFYGKGL
jgi:hypothetical protein